MSKTIISVSVEGPEVQEYFTARAELQALSPNDQAASIMDHLNFLADKARRSLGFLTQEQIQQQQGQLQQLAETLVGAGRNEPAEDPEGQPEPEREVTKAELITALRSLASLLEKSGMAVGDTFPVSSAHALLDQELHDQEMVTEPEPEPELAPEPAAEQRKGTEK